MSGFPGGSDSKESACNAGDPGLIPRSGRCPGEGNGNPLQYSCLEKTQGQKSLVSYSPRGCKELDMTEWLTLYYMFPLQLLAEAVTGNLAQVPWLLPALAKGRSMHFSWYFIKRPELKDPPCRKYRPWVLQLRPGIAKLKKKKKKKKKQWGEYSRKSDQVKRHTGRS